MSFVHTITRGYKDSSLAYINGTGGTENVTADTEINFDGEAAAAPSATSTATTTISLAIDVSQLKSCGFYADKAVTLKTNSTGAPDDTITLAAGQLKVWTLTEDGAGQCPVTVDVTSVFAINTGLTVSNLKIRCLSDYTP